MSVHPDTMRNITAMSDEERFSYFVKKCADFKEVWGLCTSDGWCSLGTDAATQTIPFWPEKGFAELFIEGDWADCTAEPIALKSFVEDWLPGMAKDTVTAAVFPVMNDAGDAINAVTVPANYLRLSLLQECEQYGGLS